MPFDHFGLDFESELWILGVFGHRDLVWVLDFEIF
jgi:hypothetical protein